MARAPKQFSRVVTPEQDEFYHGDETARMERVTESKRPGRPVKAPPQGRQITVTWVQLRRVYRALKAGYDNPGTERTNDLLLDALRTLDRRTRGRLEAEGGTPIPEAGAARTQYRIRWPSGTVTEHSGAEEASGKLGIKVSSFKTTMSRNGCYRRRVPIWDDELFDVVLRDILCTKVE